MYRQVHVHTSLVESCHKMQFQGSWNGVGNKEEVAMNNENELPCMQFVVPLKQVIKIAWPKWSPCPLIIKQVLEIAWPKWSPCPAAYIPAHSTVQRSCYLISLPLATCTIPCTLSVGRYSTHLPSNILGSMLKCCMSQLVLYVTTAVVCHYCVN